MWICLLCTCRCGYLHSRRHAFYTSSPPPPLVLCPVTLMNGKVDAEGRGSVEVEVVSDDVSTFLILSPEGECVGAKVQGFIPREDGGLSALEMHGQVWCVLLEKRNV